MYCGYRRLSGGLKLPEWPSGPLLGMHLWPCTVSRYRRTPLASAALRSALPGIEDAGLQGHDRSRVFYPWVDSAESHLPGLKDSAELVLTLNGKRQWCSPDGSVEFSFQKRVLLRCLVTSWRGLATWIGGKQRRMGKWANTGLLGEALGHTGNIASSLHLLWSAYNYPLWIHICKLR